METGPAPDEELDRFFTLSPDLLCILGFDGRLKRVNPAWEATLGFSPGESTGKPLADFAHPQDRANFRAAFERLVRGGEIANFESRFEAKDGSIRHLLWNAAAAGSKQLIYAAAREAGSDGERYQRLFATSKDAILILDARTGEVLDVNPRGIEMFGLSREEPAGKTMSDPASFRPDDLRDTLTRKNSEAALRESEERFRLLMEGVKDYAIFMLDTGGRVVSWNLGAERILGFKEAEIVGRHFGVLFTAEDQAAGEPGKQLETALLEGKAEDERWHVRKDGARFLASGILTSLWDDSGRVRGFAKVMRDVTERRKTEEALLQAQKLESIGLLAGGIAHDFNNLLTGIMGNASLAAENLPGSHAASQPLADVIDSTQRAADLTRQLLAYAGKGRFVIEQINLSELVSDILHLIQTSIPKRVRLQLELGPDLPLIEADATQIRQIVMNLTINAAESIEDQEGTVRVSTGTREVDEAGLPGAVLGDFHPGLYVFLEVSDKGSGMDPDTLSKIFDPFFTTKFTGRGLGLAAVSGIVRGHKGAIVVESSPGAGSTFRVYLPAAQAAKEPKRAQAPATDLRGAGVVLVVDDEPIVLNMAKAALERYGYTVELAADGEVAVRKFRERRDEIVAVLLDMAMPVVSGEETLQRIKEIRPDIPVIISSGHGDIVSNYRFQQTGGVAGFLQKPYKASQLAEKIKSVTGR